MYITMESYGSSYLEIVYVSIVNHIELQEERNPVVYKLVCKLKPKTTSKVKPNRVLYDFDN